MNYFRPEIAAMAGYTPGEQPQAGKFIKLNTNENPYPASPAVARAIGAVLERGLGRYPDPMSTAFRVRAGEVLGISPDSILCGNGSDDILTIVTRALVGPGERLRFPRPSYILYGTLAEIQGAQFEEVPFNADWSLSDDFTASTDKLRLAVLPNPNSPSGTLLPPERILELAERLPCPLLVDEAYVDFSRTNCLSLVAENEKIMVSRSLSKSYALAGLRFGFLVAQPHLIEQFIKVKDSYNCDALSIAGATAALDDQAWLVETRAKIIATRTRLTGAMRELGFNAVDSEANFVWSTHPSIPLRPIYEQLKAQRVLVRYMDYAGWGAGLRISVGTDEQIDALLALLRTMI
ncbi:MAG: histidinol-phosphate transaminase, partial [Planctomycetia bacterium]|nr:histidinol-phosphate transaminase [Planctomycetia bacterium]